jgi:hypothetical protein
LSIFTMSMYSQCELVEEQDYVLPILQIISDHLEFRPHFLKINAEGFINLVLCKSLKL